MTIARAQMYRQLYQLGGNPTGVQTLPMDFGQSLQVNNQGNGQGALMSPAPNYSSATSITSNPLLNYGQPELGQAGGTPLTMRSGGRIGYQEGGMGMDQMMSQDQDMMQPQSQQMIEPPLQGMEGQQPDIKDPRQALEIIIQMLIAQGLAPEEARQIALQMVQAVAEGGMGEMEDQRIEARFGGRIGYASGGIGSLVGRQGYFVGGIGKAFSSALKGAGKLVKGAVNAVKKVASSDIGKIALTVAAVYATGGGALFGGPGFASAGTLFGPGGALGGTTGLFGAAPIAGTMGPSSAGLLGVGGSFAPFSGTLASGIGSLVGGGVGGGGGSILSSLGGNALTSLAAGALGGALAGGAPQQEQGESNEDYQRRVDEYKSLYQQGVSNPTLSITNAPMNLYPNNPFYTERRADGGRIGYADGGIGDLISQVTKQAYFGTPMMANGGRIGYQEGGVGDLIKQTTQQAYFGTPMMADGGRIKYGFGSAIKMAQDSGVISPVSSGSSNVSAISPEQLNALINKKNTISYQKIDPFYGYTLEDLYNLRKKNNDYIYAANGGRIGYAMGAEVPTRQNEAGVTELDYRDTGGFVPPIGIKERADDIPAMLSNNEFVFTANAVRNAGGGDENLGAQRMYKLMKNLEKGGRV